MCAPAFAGHGEGAHGASSGKKASKAVEVPVPSAATIERALRIREAYNHLDRLEDATAQKIFSDILKEDPGNPDACLGLGLIHYRHGLMDPAVGYLVKADAARDRFLDKTQKYAAPLLLAAIREKDRRPDLEEEVLRSFLKGLTGSPDGGVSHFRDYKTKAHEPDPRLPELDDGDIPVDPLVRESAGKALFALALLTASRGTGMESRLTFERCADFGYRRRSVHLYLAHWFATRTQDDVDAAWTAWHKAHPAFPLKREDRTFLMRHHLRLMEESDATDRAEAEFLLTDVPRDMKRQVLTALSGEKAAPSPADKTKAPATPGGREKSSPPSPATPRTHP